MLKWETLKDIKENLNLLLGGELVVLLQSATPSFMLEGLSWLISTTVKEVLWCQFSRNLPFLRGMRGAST